MDSTGTSKPTFLWRGILILLPLVLLAGLGLYFLRQDRLLAEVEAKQRCQSLSDNYASILSTRLLERMESLASTQLLSETIELNTNGDLFSIDGSQQRATIPPDPIPQPFRESEPSRAAYNSGLILEARNEPVGADELFRKVEADHSATTESGEPLWLLAELKRAQLHPLNPGNIYRDTVNNPCFVTPIILARLAELNPSPSPENRHWLDLWEKDQAARDFYLHTRAEFSRRPMRWPRTFWTKWNGSDWLVLIRPMTNSNATVISFRADLVNQALRDALTNGPTQPNYAQLSVDIAGRPVLSANPRWPRLGSTGAWFTPEANNNAVVYEFLSQPALLYAQQRKRTMWFAALILVSALAATIGFVSAYRGFHQQLRLSEMKSNFVSSVSHELRAPIASMRLLAESLERGKISDETKKKEYFGFLVQESRRLSSLIENILDFSRIEQGRKKYQFEPTDLDFLVEQTFKLMQPCALERGVELELQKTDPADAPIVHGDGLAIQQALINLIDNAVKHSSQGAAVTIGLERGADSFRLWVEDDGPGIPPEDHEKIFARFYRRGSELRRETQGIGIGLSLVKHTVEAHGGRVDLRSEIGQGSRFTIELPNHPGTVKYK